MAAGEEIAFRPPPGEYPGPILLECLAPKGVTVYYTLDGSEPSPGAPVFKTPVSIEDDTVLRYFVVYPDGRRGSVQEAFYRIRLGKPAEGELRTVAEPPGGIYSKRARVTLNAKEGATVFYTIDGSEPSTDSSIYKAPLVLTVDTTLKFFSMDKDGSREPVREETYRFQLVDQLVDTTPPEARVNPLPEDYRAGDLVRITANEEGNIFYTLDGSQPGPGSAKYEGPFRLTESARLRFVAVDRGGNRSPLYEAFYSLDREAPFSEAYPETGLYTPPLTVKISVSEPEAVVHYTVNGSAPDLASPVYRDPLILSRDTVLKYFSVDPSGNREEIREATYLFDDTAPLTVADPPGGDYAPPITVSLRTEESARIHYTTDGYDPDLDSPIYFKGFVFTRPTTLKFFSVDRAGNREKIQTHRYGLVNAVWRKYARGVYLIPSVTDGRTFWMGSESGLAVYHVGSGDRTFVGSNEGLLGSVIYDLVLDEGGRLWIATDRGLNHFRSGEGFTSITTDDGLPDREVLSLAVDRDGSIWAGTGKGAALVRGDTVVQTLGVRDGLPGDRVLSITVDYSGNKWFGTNKGLAKFTGSEWRVFTKESGLIDNEIRTVAVDSQWNIWVGTGRGVSMFDREKWVSFTKDDGLPGNGVVLIAPDPDGDVWVATRTGVSRYSGGRWIRENPP